MRKILLLSALTLLVATSAFAQAEYRKPVKPTKNVIVMIPDGTSVGAVSASRWFKFYQTGENSLAIDPYLCGTVQTFNSNAPIGDSAPTTSCYMTGYLQQAGNVAIYPKVDPIHDIYPVDSTKTYQPLTTILEAAKYDLKKSTGLVVTVQFCHATPADCSSHYYDRNNYKILSRQIAYNDIDVVLGSGNRYITDDIREQLKKNNTILFQDDIEGFRKFDGDEKLWALFKNNIFDYHMDTDHSQIPTLAEMTDKAITRLSKDKNGFFLMVEGSQIDFAAHSNDAIATMNEYLAFDEAVQVAMDFAEKDGNTTVVIMTDHGNSGFTIGNRNFKNYARRGLDDVFGNVSKYTTSARNLESILIKKQPEKFKETIKEYLSIDITNEELDLLLQSKNYKEGDYMEISNSINLASSLVKIMNERTFFGFTTGGHTGEEVLLAAYHPQGNIPLGMNTNMEINKYLHDAVGLKRPLDEITAEIFAKHQDVFKDISYEIDKTSDFPILKVKKGKKTLEVPAFKSVAYLNGKEIKLGSISIYIDKNDTFYLPTKLRKML